MSSPEAVNALPLISQRSVTSIASSLKFWDDKDPVDAQSHREELVASLARLTDDVRDFLRTCDTIIIDQTSADLLGTYFEEAAGLLRNHESFVTHTTIVPSRKRPDRIVGLREDVKEAYTRSRLGTRILIVTEHADTGETCETLSQTLRDVMGQDGDRAEILIASLSVHPQKFFDTNTQRKERWVWGQRGIIGASAFRRSKLPVTNTDMAELAQKIITAIR